MPDHPPHELVVPRRSTATLAILVRGALGLTHSGAKSLIVTGRVHVDGTPSFDAAVRPRGGSRIVIVAEPVPKSRRPLEGPGFRVVHLDELFLVVEKDAGIVTVPTTKETPRDPPLVARVLAALGVAGHRVRQGLWVVHRIDRSTSGLVLFARSEDAAAELRAQFRARRPLREYVAWTQGIPSPGEGTLRHHLREHEKSRRVFVTRPAGDTREAELTYAVEAATTSGEPRARVRVTLVTGRRNQIRVQFSASGWPLLGDKFYGATDEGPGRTALHAARLGFDHPRTGEPLLFASPLPEELVRLDRRLFGYHPPKRGGPGPR